MKGWRVAKKLRKKSSCARGSFRTLTRGRTRVLICCPRGKWKKRAKRCKVGTVGYEVLKKK